MDTALVSAVGRPEAAPRQQVTHREPLVKQAVGHAGGDLPASVRRLLSTSDGSRPLGAAFQSSI